MLRTIRLSGLLAALALLLAVPAWSQPLEAGGPGGAPYTINCNPGEFVNGFLVFQGDLLDALVIYCKGVDTRTAQVTGGRNPGVKVGGPGGRGYHLECGRQGVVTGVEAITRFVNGITVIANLKVDCYDPKAKDKWVQSTPWTYIDELSGYRHRQLTCPSSIVGVGLLKGVYGGAGNLIDRIGLNCSYLVLEPKVVVPPPPLPPIDRRRENSTGGSAPQFDNYCEQYADTAILQIVRANRMRCELSGPRYTPERDNHLNWCRTVPRAWASNEEKERVRDLQACQDDKGRGRREPPVPGG